MEKFSKNQKLNLLSIHDTKEKILSSFEREDNYYSVADICSCDTDESFASQVEEWADEHCSNGHFSRWTAFGQGLYSDALKADEMLATAKKGLCR